MTNRSKSKKGIWRFLTFLVVLLLALNPEMLQLALFIDAAGLELFIFLIELQLLALFGSFLDTWIKPLLSWLRGNRHTMQIFCYLENLQQNPAMLIHVTPSPAALMQLIVIAAALPLVF